METEVGTTAVESIAVDEVDRADTFVGTNGVTDDALCDETVELLVRVACHLNATAFDLGPETAGAEIEVLWINYWEANVFEDVRHGVKKLKLEGVLVFDFGVDVFDLDIT